jgi:hypothetical protein
LLSGNYQPLFLPQHLWCCYSHLQKR